MTTIKEIRVPNIGDYTKVDVIEIEVTPGQRVAKEAPLIALETEKASVDVPSPYDGKVVEIKIKKGDKVSEGDLILTLEVEETQKQPEEKKEVIEVQPEKEAAQKPVEPAPVKTAGPVKKTFTLPDLGTDAEVSVIEWQIAPGESFKKEDTLITLEGEKASMDVPSPFEGKLIKQLVKVNDKVRSGQAVAELEVSEAGIGPSIETTTQAPQEKAPEVQAPKLPTKTTMATTTSVHAGPSVRRLANQLGVDLAKVQGTGRKGRILPTDVHGFVKQQLAAPRSGLGLEPMPAVDFSQWGDIETNPLNRIKKLTAKNLHRNWVSIPHVTNFDEADITELEEFRQDNKKSAKDMGINLTPLAFIIKAVVSSLMTYPQFNSSLSPDGASLIVKKYYHIGVAVDTPDGLVVPVVKQADQKGVFAIAKELGDLSQKARDGQLKLQDMQGGCFSISSLGGIGGKQFTPIINAPEVAILGVSKSEIKPIYQEGEFKPKLMLPLALSYDHRVIDGAEAARFMKHLCIQLEDIRKLLL